LSTRNTCQQCRHTPSPRQLQSFTSSVGLAITLLLLLLFALLLLLLALLLLLLLGGCQVFACVVGQRPSKAKFYVNDTNEVLELLAKMAGVGLPPRNDSF
jgi:uncharacterized membrane protein